MRKGNAVPEPAVRRFGRRCSAGVFGALLGFSLAFGPVAAHAENVPNNGTWDEKETVLNKDAAAAAATVTPAKPVAPAGFQFNQGANLETFLIYHLSQSEDATLPSDGASGSFNKRFGTDWYITAAIDRTGADKSLHVQLVDKADGNKVIEEKVIPAGQTVQFDAIKNKAQGSAFKFTINYKETVFTGANGEQAPYRDMKITSGVGGSTKSTVVYSSVEPKKQSEEVNDFSGIVPILSPKQTTEYREKKTGDLLASYTQTGQISGDLYTIADAAEFQRYELIESPQPTEGTLGSSYAVGSTFITYRADYRVGAAKVVVDNDGSIRFILYAVNPDHPNFKQNYNRADTPTADELQIPLVMSLLKDDSLTGEEKYARINRPDAPYLVTFVSEVTAPNEYNSEKNAFTGSDSWSHKTTKKWQPVKAAGLDVNTDVTDTFTVKLGAFTTHPNALFRFGQYHLVNDEGKFIDLDGTVTDKPSVSIGGMEQGMVNSNSLNVQNVSYYYAGKGGVKVFYVDTKGNVIKDSVTIVDYGNSGAQYSTEKARENKIVTSDGKVYYYKQIDKTNLRPASKPTDSDKRDVETTPEENGQIKQDTVLEVTYVYELAGNVNVNYIDENGNVIKDPVPDVENGKPGDPYDTDSDNKPNRITTSNGKTYEFKEVFKDSEPTTGEVEGGKTKEITYVYREITPDPETPVVTSEDKPKPGKVSASAEKPATIAPRTGDSAGAFAFAGLLALSAMGLAFSVYRTRFGK